MLKDKKPTHKQHGKPKGLTSLKGRGTPTAKDLRAERKMERVEGIDAIDTIYTIYTIDAIED